MEPIRVTATPGTSMWSLWKALPENQTKPGWQEFQHQFRIQNPEVAGDGYLQVNHTYTLPGEPGGDGTDTGAAADPDPGAAIPGGTAAIPAGPADGSSPATAIPVTATEAWAATGWNDLMKVLSPDAFVIAAKGQIGVQDFPGWEKIPGLKNLGKDQNIGFLVATLTPMDAKGMNPNFSVGKTTIFVSLTLPKAPGAETAPPPIVFTFQAASKTFEAGVAKNNPQPFKPLPGGDIILFSNIRGGVSGGDPGPTASVNGGIIFKLGSAKEIVGNIKDLVKTVTRTAEAAEVAGGLVGAPESGGTSLAGTAGGIFATEMLRGTISNALDGADWYAGAAWRGDTRMPIKEDGTVTLQANKGALHGKWITFNVKDIADDFLGLNVPNFKNPNKQWLVNSGMDPEIADAIAGQFQAAPIQDLMDQTADYLGISTSELLTWYNQQGKDWVSQFAYNRLRYMNPGEDGKYPVMLVDASGKELPELWRMPATSIKDLVQTATWDGRPMPRRS